MLFGQVAIVAIMGCRRPVSLWRLQVEPRLVAPPPPPFPGIHPGQAACWLVLHSLPTFQCLRRSQLEAPATRGGADNT